MLLFTLEVDLACGGFQMPYKIVVGNVLVFVLEGNLACARFI